MVLPTRLGLERGIHTKDGKRITSHNAFIDSVVNACSANDFIIARAFSDSESFNPRLVLIGIQYDHTIQLPEGQNEYFVPKVGAILEQLITKNSIEFSNTFYPNHCPIDWVNVHWTNSDFNKITKDFVPYPHLQNRRGR